MGGADYINQTIEQLRCGQPAGNAVSDAALLLERATGKKTGFEEFDGIDVTANQAERIKQALLFALNCHPPMGMRGSILYALSRTGDAKLKNLYSRELLSMKRTMLETSTAMFQALLALEAMGENIFPEGSISRSAHDVAMNWKCAERFLARDGE